MNSLQKRLETLERSTDQAARFTVILDSNGVYSCTTGERFQSLDGFNQAHPGAAVTVVKQLANISMDDL